MKKPVFVYACGFCEHTQVEPLRDCTHCERFFCRECGQLDVCNECEAKVMVMARQQRRNYEQSAEYGEAYADDVKDDPLLLKVLFVVVIVGFIVVILWKFPPRF